MNKAESYNKTVHTHAGLNAIVSDPNGETNKIAA